jgi:hypothetical protein
VGDRLTGIVLHLPLRDRPGVGAGGDIKGKGKGGTVEPRIVWISFADISASPTGVSAGLFAFDIEIITVRHIELEKDIADFRTGGYTA